MQFFVVSGRRTVRPEERGIELRIDVAVTRLLRIMWWLLSRTDGSEALSGIEFVVTDSVDADLELLPAIGQQFIARSLVLQGRVRQLVITEDGESPAKELQQRLHRQ